MNKNLGFLPKTQHLNCFFFITGGETKRTAVCNKFNVEYSDIRKNTVNFKKHLNSCSKIKLAEYDALIAASQAQSPISESDKELDIKDPKNLIYFIVKFLIISCSLPYRLVETERFRAFMKVFAPKSTPFTRYQVQSEIKKLTRSLNERIKSALKLAKNISLTVDLWSDRQMRSFLGVTAHYFERTQTCILYVI